MPTGCNEQVFVSWIPNIVAMKYLKATNQLSKRDEEQGKKNLEAGNQMLSNIMNSDGSYNMYRVAWWKQNEYQPHVWLTAYIAKVLSYANTFFSLDHKFIKNALNYLSKVQQEDGHFESKQLLHYEKSLNSSNNIELTAFVVIAFLKNEAYSKEFEDVINKSILYIDQKLASIKDNYELALASYAVALFEKSSVTRVTITDT